MCKEQKKCRICLEKILTGIISMSNSIPLDGETTYSDIYRNLSGFSVENGSKHLCVSCSEELLTSYTLKRRIRECEKVWNGIDLKVDIDELVEQSMEEVEIEMVPDTENEVVIEVTEDEHEHHLEDSEHEHDDIKMEEVVDIVEEIIDMSEDRKSLSMMDMNMRSPDVKIRVFEQEFDRYSIDELHKLLNENFSDTLVKQAKWLISKIEDGKQAETISAKSVLLKNFGVKYKKQPKCGVCPFCGKRVQRANSLPRHIAIHQRGTRPETRGRKRTKDQPLLTNEPKKVRPILPAPPTPLSPLIVSAATKSGTPQASNVPKYLLLLPSVPSTPVPIKMNKVPISKLTPVAKIAPKIEKPDDSNKT